MPRTTLMSILASGMFAMCGSAVGAQDNLLPNGGFEVWPPSLGWSGELDINAEIHPPTTGPIDGDNYGSVHAGGFVTSAWAYSLPYEFGDPIRRDVSWLGFWAGGTTCSLGQPVGPCQNLVKRTATLRVYDGDFETGTIVAEHMSPLEHGIGANPALLNEFDWTHFHIVGETTSGHVTVAFGWKDGNVSWSDGTGVHVDALVLVEEAIPTCTVSVDPFADVDQDGDVDQDDFGVLQRCLNGPDGMLLTIEPLPGLHCACLDVASVFNGPDGKIDQSDYAAFEACASGPGVPADPACDD